MTIAGASRVQLAYAADQGFGQPHPAGVAAQGTLTLDTLPVDGNTMTIGSVTYRFKDTPAQANDIQIGSGGSALGDTQVSIVKTLNGTGSAGTDYYTGTTTPHPTVSAASFSSDDCVLTARTAGILGNLIATTETFGPATDVFDGTTLGTTRAGAGGPMKILRVLGESLKAGGASTESAEINSSRLRTGVRRTSVDAAGTINFELSGGTFDDWILAALCASAWSTAVTVTGTTVSVSSTDNSYNDSGEGFGSFVEDQWIYATGFATAANNGWSKIVSVAAGKLIVEGRTLVTESAPETSTTVQMPPYAVNGTTMTSYNIERDYTDLSGDFALFTGMTINNFTLNIPTEGNITGTFDFLGSYETSISSSNAVSYTAATTTEPMTSLDVLALLENKVALTTPSAFTLSLSNNLRNRKIIGSSAVYSIGDGPLVVTGTLQTYYEDKALYTKYLDDTATGLVVQIRDLAGNSYLIEIPKIKFTPGGQGREATNNTTDIMPNLNWSAYKDADEEIMIRVVKVAT